MSDLSPALKIRPIINYPRVARAGERYLMTIDIQLAETGASWEYPEEEYEIAFILNTGPYFRYEVLDKSKEGVVLHRFGGTYGPAQYVLTANKEEVRLGQIGITMISKWGLPVAHVALECEVRRKLEQAEEGIIVEQEKREQQKSNMLVTGMDEGGDRQLIEWQLMITGWKVQNSENAGLSQNGGVAAYYVSGGVHSYNLFVDSVMVGDIRIHRTGETLRSNEEPNVSEDQGGVSTQSTPFRYQVVGNKTSFTNFLELEPRSRKVFTFHRPETLAYWLNQAPLKVSVEENGLLRSRLRRMPEVERAGLRKNQFEATKKLEESLAAGQQRTLVKMIDGTGITFMAVNSIYRLLKYGGAQRILYLFDINAKAKYALSAFARFYSVKNKERFVDIYKVQYLQENSLDSDAAVYVTTIQLLYQFYSIGSDPTMVHYNPMMPIEYFDAIVIGDCDSSVYVQWRSVLEYFDTLMVGLVSEVDNKTKDFFHGTPIYEQGKERPRVLVLTNLSVEYQAVRAHLSNLSQCVDLLATSCEQGRFLTEEHGWDVMVITYSSEGMRKTVDIEQAITYFQPNLVMDIGLAGGLKNVHVGDVVVASKVYEEMVMTGKGNTLSPYPSTSSYLMQKAFLEASKSDWLGRLKSSQPTSVQVYMAPILTGNELLSDPTYRSVLHEKYKDAMTYDITSHHTLTVLRSYQSVETLVIRGVSDFIDGSKQLPLEAAMHASSFAFEMLAKLDPERLEANVDTDAMKETQQNEGKGEDRHLSIFPAVVIGGPPHAGKSVLLYHLTQALRARHIPHHVIHASPDGEGNWFHEGQPEVVSMLRMKPNSEWPASFVQRISQDLEHRCLPFLVDMGGRPRASWRSLFRYCTHSILLLRQDKPDETERWQQIVLDNNLLPLAHIYSEQAGISTITELSPMLQGTITGLERHMPMQEYNSLFDKLVDLLADLFTSYDLREQERVYWAHAPTELILDLKAALQSFTTTSIEWTPAMLPAYLKSLPAQVPFSVYGVGPNWLYAALAAYAGQQAFYLFDPKLPFGWVQPALVQIGTEPSPEIRIELENYEECTVLKITFPFDRLEYFQPDPLTFPPVSSEKGIIIDGRLPYWLLTALMRLYRDVGVPWIAPFNVLLNRAVIAYSRVDRYYLGDLVLRPVRL